MVDGYGAHLEARRDIARQGDGGPDPNPTRTQTRTRTRTRTRTPNPTPTPTPTPNPSPNPCRQGDGDGRISPMWTDLTMWAVLAGQHELAIELWSKVRVRDRARTRDRVRVRAPNPNPNRNQSDSTLSCETTPIAGRMSSYVSSCAVRVWRGGWGGLRVGVRVMG